MSGFLILFAIQVFLNFIDQNNYSINGWVPYSFYYWCAFLLSNMWFILCTATILIIFSWVATYKTTGGADAAAAFVILIWVLFWEFFALILHTSTQSYNGSFIFAVILTIYVHFVLYITMQISHLKNKLESSSFPPKRDAIRERKMKLLFLTIALILILTCIPLNVILLRIFQLLIIGVGAMVGTSLFFIWSWAATYR